MNDVSNMTDYNLIWCRHDVIAQLSHAKRLAEKLYPCARMVELSGGHLVSHERTEEVHLSVCFTSIIMTDYNLLERLKLLSHKMLIRFPPSKLRSMKL